MIFVVLIILAVIGFAMHRSDLSTKEKLLLVLAIVGVLITMAYWGGHISF